jgi:hypothetical protein
LLIIDLQRRMEMARKTKLCCDELRLIDTAAAEPADIDLLQGHNIGAATRNHLRDAFGCGAAINAKAAANVVGREGQRRLARHLRVTGHLH